MTPRLTKSPCPGNYCQFCDRITKLLPAPCHEPWCHCAPRKLKNRHQIEEASTIPQPCLQKWFKNKPKSSTFQSHVRETVVETRFSRSLAVWKPRKYSRFWFCFWFMLLWFAFNTSSQNEDKAWVIQSIMATPTSKGASLSGRWPENSSLLKYWWAGVSCPIGSRCWDWVRCVPSLLVNNTWERTRKEANWGEPSDSRTDLKSANLTRDFGTKTVH